MNANTKEKQLILLETLVKEWSNTAGRNNNMPEIRIINLVDKINNNNKNTIYNEIITLSKYASDERFKDGNYLVEILKNNNNKLPNSYTALKNIMVTPSQERRIKGKIVAEVDFQ